MLYRRDNIVPARDVFAHVLDIMGSNQVRYGLTHTDFDLILGLDSLSDLHAEVLGLHTARAIYMHVRLPPVSCGGEYRPAVQFSLGDRKLAIGKAKEADIAFPHNKVLYVVCKICKTFFKNHWPCQNKHDTLSFLARLYRHVQTSIPQLGNFCVVCGRRQKHIGLKPVPCRSRACNFSFTEHGIGADLKIVYSQPVVADLLISMASATSQCVVRRDHLFGPVPSELLQNDCCCFTCCTSFDWECIEVGFGDMPPVALMARQQNLHKFFQIRSMGFVTGYDGMTSFTLLRSVLNSCQGHLIHLQEADRFPEMKTDYQFRLCMDSPRKEAVFSWLRARHGSKFLFHGSPFYNWHGILRGGLKNMSHSKMMETGASFGNGIYLSEFSSTSASYCRKTPHSSRPLPFSGSIFGQDPVCIALCEVINNSFNSNTASSGGASRLAGSGIRVLPDAKRVITRYLFVYPAMTIPAINASYLSARCKMHEEIQAETLRTVKKAFKSEWVFPSRDRYQQQQSNDIQHTWL